MQQGEHLLDDVAQLHKFLSPILRYGTLQVLAPKTSSGLLVLSPQRSNGHTRGMQQTFLITLTTGILTAAAVLTASWLTSRATIAATRLQVTSHEESQRRDRTRESRRSAYVELLTLLAEVRWRSRDLVTRAAAGDATALTEYRAERNSAGREFPQRRYVVHLVLQP